MYKYYIIISDENGMTVDELTKEELEKRLDEEYYGKKQFSSLMPKFYQNQFHGPFDGIIIKGKIVVPKVVATVTKTEVE